MEGSKTLPQQGPHTRLRRRGCLSSEHDSHQGKSSSTAKKVLISLVTSMICSFGPGAKYYRCNKSEPFCTLVGEISLDEIFCSQSDTFSLAEGRRALSPMQHRYRRARTSRNAKRSEWTTSVQPSRRMANRSPSRARP